ncbi:MAG TPA: helix-turn-helix transcriptional regulator [Candidatus Angelobacter sp.]|nr:helix-turn-helix transcriptional regulator [Candidatus Angelobacter sp.]
MQDPTQIREKLGERVRRLREKRGWSQETLAHETGFGRSFMSAIERGKKDLRLSTLCKLANIFEITLTQLIKNIDL